MNPIHDSYEGLRPDASVNVADVATLAGVELDTAQRWAKRDDFPAGADADEGPVWTIGAVLGWLCSTGRISGCAEIDGAPVAQLYTYDEVCELTGLSKQSVKQYRWKGSFPEPDGPRVGKSPTWLRSTIAAWIDARVDHRRKVEA